MFPYKEEVGGSSPSTPTKNRLSYWFSRASPSRSLSRRWDLYGGEERKLDRLLVYRASGCAAVIAS